MHKSAFGMALGMALITASACRTDVGIAPVEPDPHDYAVELLLERGAATAGAGVGYQVVITDRGQAVEGARWTLSSDLEDYVSYTLEELTPVVAGEHLLTVLASADGWTGTAQATLSVSPAAPYDLDLVLSDAAMRAGQRVGFEVLAVDAFGNDVDAAAATVSTGDDALVVDGDGLTGTVPGVYLVSAILGSLEDVEPLLVEPGEPADLTVDFTPRWPGLNGTGSAIVSITDDWGNPVDAPWTLSASRPDDTTVSGRNVTFWAEGWFELTVRVDGTSLTESIGPFLIDDTGPELAIDWPSRGQWTTATSETVRGTASDDWSSVSLSINGAPVSVGADGTYAHPIDLPWGVTVVETEAVDGNGNVSTDSRAVLAGSFLGYGQRTNRGIDIRIQEGPGGTGVLEALGESLVDSTDLNGIIPNPVFNDREEDCWQECWRVCLPSWLGGGCWEECTPEVCVEWYAVNVTVNNPSIGPSDLLIDPKADASLLLRGTIEDPSFGWNASGRVIGIGYSASGRISADYVVVDVLTRPTVSAGAIDLPLASVNSSIVGFNPNFPSWLRDALQFFGLYNSINSLIRDPMEDAITDAVRSEVPPLLEEALNDLELVYPFQVADRTFNLDAIPTSIRVNEVGMNLSLGTKLTVDRWVHAGQGLGSLQGPFAVPTYPRPPHMFLAFSADFLNQFAYGAWGAGLLDIEESIDELGLDSEELALILPGVESITAVVNPLLPPVVVPGTGPEEFDLQVGDLELTLYDGPVEDGDVLIQVYVTAIVGLDLRANGSTSLLATPGNPELWFDVTVPESNTQAAADTEALVGALVPLLLPRITDVFSEIDIPSIDGFALRNVEVSTGGGSNAWLVVRGDLAVAP